MKKVIVVILAFSLLMTFAVMPVLAEPTKGQKVPATMRVIGAFLNEWVDDVTTFTNGDTAHSHGGVLVFKERLLIGDPLTKVGDFKLIENTDGMTNLKTGLSIVHCETEYILLSDPSSGFSGHAELRIWDFNPDAFTWSYWTVHEVAQGFGAFEGQTLMLSYEGPQSLATPFTGYLLMPKS